MTLTNLNTGKRIIFGNEYLVSSINWGEAPATHNISKSVGQMGSTIVGTSIDNRNIQIIGYILLHDAHGMDMKKRELTSFFNPLQTIEIEHNNLIIQSNPTSTIKYATSSKDNNSVICKFTITLFCPYPFFSTLEEIRHDLALWIKSFEFPLSIGEAGIEFAYRQLEVIINVPNGGDVPIGMVIVFKALGTLVNPMVFNVETREFIRIKATMQQGDIITINTNYGKKRIERERDGVIENIANLIDLDSTFSLGLKVGDNLLRYDAEQNIDNLEASVYYRPAYLEV